MGELFGFGIVHLQVAARARDREQLRRRMGRALLAEIRVGEGSHGGCDPDPAIFIKHRIVDVVLAGPDHLVAPIGRRLRHVGTDWRRVWVTYSKGYSVQGMSNRIQYWP